MLCLGVVRKTIGRASRGRSKIQRSAKESNFQSHCHMYARTAKPKSSHPSDKYTESVFAKVFALKLYKLGKFFLFAPSFVAVHMMESQLVEGRYPLFTSCCCVLYSRFLVVCLFKFYCQGIQPLYLTHNDGKNQDDVTNDGKMKSLMTTKWRH